MPGFLAGLLVLVSSFILGGKPVDLPPFITDEISQRGSQVSELVRHFPSLTPSPTPSDESESNINVQTGDNNENKPDVTKVPAYNNRSEKEMPTTIPQTAIDHSKALDPSPSGVLGAQTNNGQNGLVNPGNSSSNPGSVGGGKPDGDNEENEPGPGNSDFGKYQPLEIHGPNGAYTVSQ